MDKYIINEEFLDNHLKNWSNSLVGETMRRFEIHTDVKDIKKAVKELLHENTRHLKSLIIAFSSGVKFVSKPKED